MNSGFNPHRCRPASAAERKLVQSLQHTKHRRDEGLFTIEGTRGVCDTLGLFPTEMIIATNQWLEANASRLSELPEQVRMLTASPAEMARMSTMKAPQGVLAVCRIPVSDCEPDIEPDELVLALDCVQDPGNLGTIIRLADWFGVRTILASTDTVDVYNPKVVQATMGALARVKVHYCNLPQVLAGATEKWGIGVFGTFLNGDNIYEASLPAGAILVMGNEGNGISDEVARSIGARLLIPSFPPGMQKVESLNVATATAIALGEWRRRLWAKT